MSEKTIKFTEKWGNKSWKVEYKGKYDNDRPPHVEVDENYKDLGGKVFKISNIKATGKAIMWTVEGIKNKNKDAHFTVYFGENAKEKLDSFK
jgi:hypothetical protein